MAQVVTAMSLTPEEEQELLMEHVEGQMYAGTDPDDDETFPQIEGEGDE